MTEDEMVGIINSMNMSLNTLGDSEGQGSLLCYSLQGPKESGKT